MKNLSAFSILYMLLFVLGVCKGTCNTLVKPEVWKMFMGIWAVYWSTSSIPPTTASYRKEELRGLNSDRTLAVFTLSGDVSGCLEYQQIGMAVVLICGCFVALSASQIHAGTGKWNKASIGTSLPALLLESITNRRALSDESE